MSIQPINIGQTANDGNGETLRAGGAKINANFAELDLRTSQAQGVADAAAAGLADKVDKVAGLGLSEASFTQQEKTKLAGLESPHFRGTFTDLTALVSGVLAPVPGDYADVDTAGADAVRYIWDDTDNVWLAGGSADPITAAQVKSLYESNPDTNAFTNAEKAKLANSATTTDGLTEGGINKYWTGARTLGTALTGLVLDSAAVIAATDSVLSGLGKLQAQISAHVGKGGAGQHPVSTAAAAGFMPAFPSITDGKTYAFKNGAFSEVTAGGGNSNVFGEIKQLPGRNFTSTGVILGDGQLLSNAAAQYPDAWAALQLATPPVPVTTPALWLSDPTKRGCWAVDVANNQIRVPDYNGRQAGSIGPVMFRADGTLGFAPGTVRQDQFQSHTFGIPPGNTASTHTKLQGYLRRIWGSNTGSATFSTVFAGNEAEGAGTDGTVINMIPTALTGGTPRTGTETFPTHIVGVWGVVLFGAVVNAGAADAAALATSYANQQAAITALNGNIACAIVYPGGTEASPATIAPNTGVTFANPFPGYPLLVSAEMRYGGKWDDVGFIYVSNLGSYGVRGSHLMPDDIISVRCGSLGPTVIGGSPQGSALDNPANITTAQPFRVRIWKIKQPA